MGRLSGKVAIITGAGQGCGLGMAQAFASEGCAMVITGRDAGKLAGVVPDLEKRGGKVAVCPGDAGKRENAQRAVDLAVQTFGGLDILVNNAQTARPGVLLEDVTDEIIDLTFGSGFFATFYHMQAAFPHLKAKGGSIINLGSKVGIIPDIGQATYGANKEAIRGLSRNAAKEWGKYAIRVNVLNPGATSPGAMKWAEDFPEVAHAHFSTIPLGFLGDSEKDIGPVALFLASDDAHYVTGQTFNIDGGQVML